MQYWQLSVGVNQGGKWPGGGIRLGAFDWGQLIVSCPWPVDLLCLLGVKTQNRFIRVHELLSLVTEERTDRRTGWELTASACHLEWRRHNKKHNRPTIRKRNAARCIRCIASRRQQSPVGVFDPLTAAEWLFHASEQTTATAASLSKDFGCGTVFLLLRTPNITLATFRNRL